MRRLFVVALLALVASSAAAFNTDQLLATIAMPLAVDAVSNVTGVPQDRLATLVSELNQANVQPTQFVEVVRYVPVALVPQPNQPIDLTQYVQNQIANGVTGDALVNAIVQQLSSNYNVTPQMTLTEPAPVIVEQTDYIPQPVIAQIGGTGLTTGMTTDPLSLAMLPLAVAAVSNIAGVPQDQLANLVATLDNANVPVVQEIQIIRYVPVALVDNGPQFVQFVQQQTAQGITGTALVPVVTQQIQTYYPQPQQVQIAAQPAPAQTVFTPEPPPVVINRVTEVRQHPMHPFGGPPGQLKKQYGYQTGAEVVHGTKPGRQFPQQPAVVQQTPAVVQQPAVARGHGHGEGEGHGRGHEKGMRPMISAAPAPAAPPVVVAPPQAQPGPVVVAPGHGRGPEGQGPPGQQKEHGNGNGKGHGKD